MARLIAPYTGWADYTSNSIFHPLSLCPKNRCVEERPELRAVDGRLVSCHFAEEIRDRIGEQEFGRRQAEQWLKFDRLVLEN